MALKSWRSSATRTSMTRHSIGIVSPADERARDIDPPSAAPAIRHNSSDGCETTGFPRGQAVDVYRKLKAGQISGRAVLIPTGAPA